MQVKMYVQPAIRPIYYKGRKAVFHQWSPFSYIVPPSLMVGGHDGGVVSGTRAIIETDNGVILEVLPMEIQFADPGYISEVWNNQRIRPMKKEGDPVDIPAEALKHDAEHEDSLEVVNDGP